MKKHQYRILAVMILIAFITVLIFGLQYNANQHRIRLERERLKLEEEAQAERARVERETRLVRENYEKAIKGISIKMSDEVKINTQDSGIVIAELKGELARTLKANDFNSLMTDLRLQSLTQLKISDEGLKNIATKLSSFKSLKRLDFIHISGSSITIGGVKNFISSLAFELPDMEGFRIGLVECPFVRDISPIADVILTKFKNLKELALEFEEFSMTNQEIKKLASVLSENGQSLTTLKIKIAACKNVGAEGFKEFHSEFFKGLPNLTSLTLDYWNTQITNKAIFSLSEHISEYCKNLQTLIINTPDCPGVTTQAPKYLAHQLSLNPLPSLKLLEFNAGGILKDAASDVRKELGNDINIKIN